MLREKVSRIMKNMIHCVCRDQELGDDKNV